ncbi:hypothetical protein FACS189445_4600 [Spirochaetia bacterium]|nr:hypothetical protein FACS189445_4600 [Spirochaetia bacterium]
MFFPRKAILSLLISIPLFAGFTVLAYTGLFDLVEARFYNPSVTGAINRELTDDTNAIEQFLEELQTRFAATLEDEAVQRSFLTNQDNDDIRRRATLYGILIESLPGLQSVRFIDAQGSRIHYSTWQPDILRRDRDSITYQNYTESPGYIPYWQVETPDQENPHIVIDDIGERLIFSHPFSDFYGIYRGTALFSLSVRALMDRMAAEGRIKVGEDVSVISEPAGMVTGLPHAGKSAVLPLIAQVWHDNILSLGRLHSGLTDTKLALMSMKTSQGIYIGRLIDEALLGFPRAMRLILLASFLLTVYLIIFLALNIRQDNMTVIQNRIKRLQINLIEEYHDAKGDLDWNRWRKELQERREDLHTELKRDLRPDAKNAAEIDALIDKSWDELLAVIGGGARTGIDEEKLKALLDQVHLRAPAPAQPPKQPDDPQKTDEPEGLEALGDFKVWEDLEKQVTIEPPPAALDEPIELAEPEKLEELEELEEIEELEAIEPPPAALHRAPENQKKAKKIEELEAIEPIQELDPSELVESAEGSIRVNPASEIEFTPPSEAIEKQQEEEAKSMAENLKIQSPFTAIFSYLSKGEPQTEGQTVEDTGGEPRLEALAEDSVAELIPEDEEPAELLTIEEEAPEPDDFEPGPLKMYFVKPLFSVPFSTTRNTGIEVRSVQDMDNADDTIPILPLEEENTVIAKRDGVPYINERALSPDKGTTKKLDLKFKRLVESVLTNTILLY